MVSYDFHQTPDFISKDFIIPRVVTCFLQFLDIVLVTKY